MKAVAYWHGIRAVSAAPGGQEQRLYASFRTQQCSSSSVVSRSTRHRAPATAADNDRRTPARRIAGGCHGRAASQPPARAAASGARHEPGRGIRPWVRSPASAGPALRAQRRPRAPRLGNGTASTDEVPQAQAGRRPAGTAVTASSMHVRFPALRMWPSPRASSTGAASPWREGLRRAAMRRAPGSRWSRQRAASAPSPWHENGPLFMRPCAFTARGPRIQLAGVAVRSSTKSLPIRGPRACSPWRT